jgi:hypothetical protein
VLVRKGSDILQINARAPIETAAIIIFFVIAVAIAAAQSMLTTRASAAR